MSSSSKFGSKDNIFSRYVNNLLHFHTNQYIYLYMSKIFCTFAPEIGARMKEDQHTEFKRLWKDEFFRELSAFANSQGGTLYIGVEDDGTVVGVKDAKLLLQDMPNKIKNNLGFLADVNLQSKDGKEVVAIHVTPQENAISYEGKYYVRSGSTAQELRGQQLASFLMQKAKLHWDALTRPEAKLSDLDDEAWNYFITTALENKRLNKSAQTESKETVLRKLNLMTEDGELTNAALMLFGKDIERWSPLSAFRIGRFGVNQADLIIHDNIVCPLVLMPDAVIDTLRTKYLVSTVGYEGLHRKETLEMPEDGLREMICNAIMHRDYLGTFIHMRVWADRIQLWNEGTLPQSITIEKLMGDHESMPRNPLIAKVFYLMGFIENWGRGYEKIRDAFEQAHLQVPTFEQVRGGIMATIQREVFQKVQSGQITTGSTTPKTTLKTTLKTTQKIIDLIRQDSKITIDQMAMELGLTRDGINYNIKKLKKDGRLRRIKDDNGEHWDIIK